MGSNTKAPDQGKQNNDYLSHAKVHSDQSTKHPFNGTRKNSISDKLNRLTDKANPFSHHRRRLTIATSSSRSTSLANFSTGQSYSSRLPTPSGITRTTSFFGGLAAHTAPGNDENNKPAMFTGLGESRTRKVSDRFNQLPVFNQEQQVREFQTQILISPYKQVSSVQIQHRGLMAPIQPAPLPRSSTVGNIAAEQDRIPSFMRLTSSSAHRRRESINMAYQSGYARPYAHVSHSMVKARQQQAASNQARKSLAPGTQGSRPTNQVQSLYQMSAPRVTAPVISSIAAPHQVPVGAQTRKFPQSAHIPPATRIPTPARELLTPEYANLDEDERDKRAEYIEPITNGNTNSSGSDNGETDTDDQNEGNEDAQVAPITDHVSVDSNPTPLFRPPSPNITSQNDLEVQSHPTAPNGAPSYAHSSVSTAANSNSHPNHSTTLQNPNLHLISTAHSNPYWLGRHTALSDHLLTSSLSSADSLDPAFHHEYRPPSPTTTTTIPTAAGPDQVALNRLIFAHLRELCTTDEAKESLEEFKVEFEMRKTREVDNVAGVKNQGKKKILGGKWKYGDGDGDANKEEKNGKKRKGSGGSGGIVYAWFAGLRGRR